MRGNKRVQNFKMIDVGRKRPTHRRAVASGMISLGRAAYIAVKENKLPKGDALVLAEIAGIAGAKNTPSQILMCHSLPLDQVTLHSELDDNNYTITVFAQAVAFAKTGVEMEALAAVHAALLTIWDLTKGTEPNLKISDIKLLVKTGGRSGVWVNPDGIPPWLEEQLPQQSFLQGKKAAVVVMSDRASRGEYTDESGVLLNKFLSEADADIVVYKVIPDEQIEIEKTLLDICRNQQPHLLVTSGGTGPGPRDMTPDVLSRVSDRMLDGFGDMLRHESLYYTDTAWLSRMTACMIGSTLVIALPGSPKAVQECWDIISPFLGTALDKIIKQGFEVK